ncbi:MAG TPA: C45 family peptidase [Verrucomicrobiae bacterium]
MTPARKWLLRILIPLGVLAVIACLIAAALFPTPKRALGRTLLKLADVVEPANPRQALALSGQLVVTEAQGAPKGIASRTVHFAFEAPDRLRLATDIEKLPLTVARDRGEIWIYSPAKKFGVIGKPGVPRFSALPNQLDNTQLPPFRLPVSRWALIAALLALNVEELPPETVAETPCQVLHVKARPSLVDSGKLPAGELRLWLRNSDQLPARVRFEDGKGLRVVAEFRDLLLAKECPAEKWKLVAKPDEKIETVAVSHLARFIPSALSLLNVKTPTLGPARGERRVVATEGQGRLEIIDDTRVLFLKGTPEEMGRQHGTLMRQGVRNLVDRILYGVGVGSSFEKGNWFFGEIERAQAAVQPFMDPRYLAEMDAMGDAAGMERQEMRLANIFPELFHCSGFALFGKATTGGRIYHGRILDYMKGVGLEPNAVVIIHQPDYGHAWANVSYAGFVGSVTAMNEKHISIGEMGGRGEGKWQGKPMAQLVREVMEKASTLDEAVEIMRRGPRTCEYYYVVADGKAHTAVGIAATPDKFEVVLPGASHPLLPHPVEDAVLLSAGDRYEKLAARVKEGYGNFDDEKARRLMDRPVAMNSNIHSVLFAPDTLDFWVANADSQNVASHTRYTHYNLAELLKSPPGK